MLVGLREQTFFDSKSRVRYLSSSCEELKQISRIAPQTVLYEKVVALR